MSGLPTGLCRLLATARPRRPSGAALMASQGPAEKAQVEHPVVGIGFDVPLYGAVQRGE